MPKATQLVSSKARIQTQLFKPVLPLNHYGGTRHQALGILVFRTHQNINNVGSEVKGKREVTLGGVPLLHVAGFSLGWPGEPQASW